MTWAAYFQALANHRLHEDGDCVRRVSLHNLHGAFALGEWYTVTKDEGGACFRVTPLFGPDKGKEFTAMRGAFLPYTTGL